MGFDVAEDGGLDAAEAEEEWRVGGTIADRMGFGFDLREGEGSARGLPWGARSVDPGAAGVAEAEELGDLVEGFAGGVVDGVAEVAVVPGWCRGARRDRGGCGRRRRRTRGADRRVSGECGGVLHQDGVDVAFEMVDANQRLPAPTRRPWLAETDEQRAGKARAFGNGDGVEIRMVTPASRRAASTTGTMARRCSREANSGTTPP